MTMDEHTRKGLIYAFGHMVSSHMIDAHSADSGELADEVLDQLGLTEGEKQIVEALAEHVHGNYEYTGEAVALQRAIERGEV